MLTDEDFSTGDVDLRFSSAEGDSLWVDCGDETHWWRCDSGEGYFAVLPTGTWTVDVCEVRSTPRDAKGAWTACSGSASVKVFPETETLVTVELDQCYHRTSELWLDTWEYRELTGCAIE